MLLRNALLATSSNGISQDRFGKERERPLFEGKQTQTVVACEVKSASGASFKDPQVLKPVAKGHKLWQLIRLK